MPIVYGTATQLFFNSLNNLPEILILDAKSNKSEFLDFLFSRTSNASETNSEFFFTVYVNGLQEPKPTKPKKGGWFWTKFRSLNFAN